MLEGVGGWVFAFRSIPFQKKFGEVAASASSEFVAVISTMECEHQKTALASEWSMAMDIILTEIKEGPWHSC